MQELVSNLAMLVVPAVLTWFLARRKNVAEGSIAEIEAESRAAEFYRSLLDDATKRLDTAIDTIQKQDQKIRDLIQEIEYMTDELKKYKQLNGKQP
jgi:hypothetical protein